MAVYAVGDIQGCVKPLQQLLHKVKFNPAKDVLWCVGDLVNRGPDSLAVLRLLKQLGDACVCVLGNHDLHLLEVAAGGKTYRSDDFDDILQASDSKELITWLRRHPLLHIDEELGWAMVHAGLPPQWPLTKVQKKAKKVAKILRGHHWKDFCLALQQYEAIEKPRTAMDKCCFTTLALTRTRYCSEDGIFDWQKLAKQSASPKVTGGSAETHVMQAWYECSAAWRGDIRVVYGHWAAKGLVDKQPHVLGLDSGCVWGGCMTMARLDVKKEKLFSVRCPAYQSID